MTFRTSNRLALLGVAVVFGLVGCSTMYPDRPGANIESLTDALCRVRDHESQTRERSGELTSCEVVRDRTNSMWRIRLDHYPLSIGGDEYFEVYDDGRITHARGY